MKPCLKHTEWPSGSTHPHVVHQWPSQDELCVQYMVLCARIREAVASHGVLHDAWLSVRRCTVEPVTHCHRLQRTLVSLLHTRLRLSLCGAHSTAGRDAAAVAWVAAVVATILDFVFPCPLGGGIRGACRRTLSNRMGAPPSEHAGKLQVVPGDHKPAGQSICFVDRAI